MRTSTILPFLLLALASGGATSPGIAGPVGSDSLRARFAQPDQTIEYHFMLELPAVPEDSLVAAFASRFAAPLRAVADVDSLGACETCAYADTRGRALGRHDLIVRVRERHVTVKARASAPDRLLDLPACASRKYELDEFGAAEFSISTDLKFKRHDEVAPFTGDATRVWSWIASNCPELWQRLRPVVTAAGSCVLPGIAHTYTAAVTLRHADAALAREASLAVWYFPPTGKALVELSFTGAVRDHDALERMNDDVRTRLRVAALLRADQSSKTEQYFGAYADTAVTPRR